MEFFVSEEATGLFIWGLREADGEVIAASAKRFESRDAALAAARIAADGLRSAPIEGE